MNQTRSKLPASLRKALNELELNKEAEVKLTLKELVKAAEISERTIRYYIQEGVLPPPQGSGPASRYSLEHLRRLSLVRRFKAALLPLSRIKQLFDELTPTELEEVANQFYNDLAASNPLLEGKNQFEQVFSQPTNDVPLEVFNPPQFEPFLTAAAQKAAGADEQTLDVLALAGNWDRIALAPGLEVHYQIDGPQDNHEGRLKLVHLVEFAKRLYH